MTIQLANMPQTEGRYGTTIIPEQALRSECWWLVVPPCGC